MGQFVRDQRLANLTIDEATLNRLDDVFLAQVHAYSTAALAAHTAPVAAPAPAVAPAPAPAPAPIGIPFYVIRFDDKGYRFINFSDVVKHYVDAGAVERVIYMMDTVQHRQSNGLVGGNFEIRLDAKDPNNCWLLVTADDKNWVDATFSAVTEVLDTRRSWTRFIRTPWTGLAIQLMGVAVGFGLSLWAAVTIAPMLAVENAFVVTFFFALLLYSNLWGYINAQISRLIDYACPNIRYKRTGKDFVARVVETVVLGLAIALAVILLQWIFKLMGGVLGGLIK